MPRLSNSMQAGGMMRAALRSVASQVGDRVGLFVQVYAWDGCEEVEVGSAPEGTTEDARRFVFKAEQKVQGGRRLVSIEMERRQLRDLMATGEDGINFIAATLAQVMKLA